MKKVKTLVTNIWASVMMFMAAAIVNVNLVLADPDGGSGNTIWDKSDGAAAKFMENITTTYSHWFPVLFIVLSAAYFLTKDQRAKEVEKKIWIGSVVVYVFCSAEVQGVVMGTLDWVASLFA